jgi:nucleoside-diphosphate-sugar epimerase
MERTIADAGVPYTVVRLPEVYGPNVTNALMGAVFVHALAGKPLRWSGPLDAQVEYVYRPDGAAAMVRAGLDERSDGETFHVPGAAATTPREFLGEVIRQAGTRARIQAIPPLAVRVVGLGQPLAGAFADILHLWTHPILLDGGKYERCFGPVPRTPYPDGIAHTLAWFREHYSPVEPPLTRPSA